MIDPVQFTEWIIKPTLEALHLQSARTVELLLGTALQESNLKYLKQLGNGPAMGVYQMEPATHDDIWNNYLKYKPDLAGRIQALSNIHKPLAMVGNLWYATAMARVHYLRVSDPLPGQGDYEGQAAYWKEFYNTHMGAGTEDEYLENWNNYLTVWV